MGTYSDGLNKKQQIAVLTDEKTYNKDSNDRKFTLLKKALIGNQLWTAWQQEFNGNVQKYIHLDLLSMHDGKCWYKPMGESCGPFYYDCPVSFLDIVPDSEEYTNEEWRRKVRQQSKIQKHIKELDSGDIVWDVGCGQFTIVKLEGRRGIIGRCHTTNQLYRIRKNSIDRIRKNDGTMIKL